MNEQPQNHIEQAAELAFEAAEDYLQSFGSGIKQAFLILEAQDDSLPENEDQVAAAHNVDSPVDLFAMLAVHLTAVGKAIGMRVDLIPQSKPRGQG